MKSDFDELYQRHAAEVYRYLCRLLGTRLAAQELLQETFLKLHLHLDADRELPQARAWLFHVATNLAHNHRRSELRASQREAQYEFGARVLDFHQQLVEQQLLERALASLTPQMRRVMLLSAEGFSYREIAEITGITAGYVGVLIARGRTAFKQFYQQQHGSGSTEKLG